MKKVKGASEPIQRICDACLDYVEGKIDLKETCDRIRGDKNLEAIKKYPEKLLGNRLLVLAVNIKTYYGTRNDLIELSIKEVARYIKLEREESPLN